MKKKIQCGNAVYAGVSKQGDVLYFFGYSGKFARNLNALAFCAATFYQFRGLRSQDSIDARRTHRVGNKEYLLRLLNYGEVRKLNSAMAFYKETREKGLQFDLKKIFHNRY